MNNYSNKDFTGINLSDRKDMSGLTIEGSCFCQWEPLSVFPLDMTGTTFIDCNLDNVILPVGNVVVRGSVRKFRPQEDGNDWEIDDNGHPIKILGT